MELNWTNALWIALTAFCFAVGFLLSWRKHKNRIQARYQAAVLADVDKKIFEDVVRRLTQGEQSQKNESHNHGVSASEDQ